MSDIVKPKRLTRAQMAWRAAQDIADNTYVNLGIGIPEMVAAFLAPDRNVTYHTENGILGFGPRPPDDEIDFDLVNAGKKPVSLLPGASFFHHADSFSMIRGGHIDLAILGAFQVAMNGDLANWIAGDDAVPAVGGAMDLVSGASSVAVITGHTTRDGQAKLVERCTYPLTGLGVVTRIYTDLAVIHVKAGKFVLREIIAEMDISRLQDLTGAPLHVEEDVGTLSPPDLG